jgi:membrane associated rhomboid family serine protease
VPRGRNARWLAVLEAANIPCEEEPGEGETVVRVPPEQLDRALAELETYEQSSATWPPPEAAAERDETPGAVIWSLFLVGTLLWFHLVTGSLKDGGGYFDPGVLATGLVRQGQWWRLVTALTLHADFSHVAANAMALFLLGIAASHQLGPGLAWLLAFAGGVGGNALEAFVTDPERHSLGASTSVFAFVAILGALRFVALVRAEGPPKSVWARSWLPLFGALGALGFLGTSHGSDVAGHALGFVTGGVLGVSVAMLPKRKLGDVWQFLFCAIPPAVVTWAWHVAMLHAGGS